jgi:hypothetical protein
MTAHLQPEHGQSGRRDAMFARADFWRTAPRSPRMTSDYKEWSHFSVLGGDFDLLINFSLVGGRSAPHEATARLTLLFRGKDGVWEGDVETYSSEEAKIAEGSPDAAFGQNGSWFARGRYHVEVQLAERDVTVIADLRPLVGPILPRSIALADAQTLRWVVAPRLAAEGEAIVRGRRYSFRGAPSYHDRNWGRFPWGGGYAWEWATIIPAEEREPWCLVYSRIADRNRGATASQSLILWRRNVLARKFYGRDLSIAHHGLLRRDRPLQIPRAVALAAQGAAVDVPRRMSIAARGYGDELRVDLELEDFAQIIAPNDGRPGFTALSEMTGRARVAGRVGGERLSFDALTQVEFNHAPA